MIRLGAKYMAQEKKFARLLEETYDYGQIQDPVERVRMVKKANKELKKRMDAQK